MTLVQGVWKVADYGRLERHDEGQLAGLWLGPNWGSGVDDTYMKLLQAHGLVLISEQEVQDESGGRVRRQCAVLTEKGAALARTPDPHATPAHPALQRRVGQML